MEVTAYELDKRKREKSQKNLEIKVVEGLKRSIKETFKHSRALL